MAPKETHLVDKVYKVVLAELVDNKVLADLP